MIALLAGEWAVSHPEARPDVPAGPMAAGMVILAGALMRWGCNTVLGRIKRGAWKGNGAGRAPGRLDLLLRAVVVSVYALLLCYGGWAHQVEVGWGLRPDRVVLAGEVLLLAPYLALELLRLAAYYPINRHVREQLMVAHLAQGLAARPVWSLRQYVVFNLRGGLLVVMLPVLAIMALRDTVGILTMRWAGPELSSSEQAISEAAAVVGAGVVFLFAPLMLRRIWRTRSLPVGPLRRKLEAFCEAMKLRHRDILLWETHSAVANAAVTGVVGRLRYVLLSDALVETMPDEQIKAVFGHEAGHVRHKHIPFLVLFVLGSVGTCGWVVEQAAGLLDEHVQETAWLYRWQEYWAGALGLAAFAGWVMLFGWVSRRFERQADVFGAQAVGAENDAEATGRLSTYGAAVMAAALDRIALLNGIPARARSLRHSSIASRMAFLKRLSEEEGELERFGRTVRRVKWGIVLLLGGCIALWAL